MNASVASQSGRAFAKMGEDLARVGVEATGIFEKAAKIHEDGEMIKLQQELDGMYSEYDKKMLESPNDVMSWRDGWDKMTAKKQLELDSRDMSRTLRQRANQFASGYYSKRGISISGNQHRTVVGNTQASARVRLDDLEARGDNEGLIAFTTELGSANILPTHELEARVAKAERLEDEMSMNSQMKENPFKFQQDYDAGKLDNSNIHPDKLAKMYADAGRIGAAKRMDAYKRLDNNSYPSVAEMQKDPDYAELSPKQQINVTKSFNDKLNTSKDNYYKDPRHFDEIQGKQESLIRKIDNGSLSSVDGVALLRSNQKFVNDPTAKARFEKQIERIELNEKQEITNRMEFGENAINLEFDTRDDENPKPAAVKTTRKQAIMLDEKFFTKENLKSFGIKDKQIDVILEAEADVGGKDVDISGFDEQVTKGAQMKALTAILGTPSARDNTVTVSEGNQQIIDSILAGQPSDVLTAHIPRAATDAWKQKQILIDANRNKTLQSYRQFIRLNPRATELEIQRHIRGNEKLIRSSGSSIIAPPPTRGNNLLPPKGTIDERP